MYADYMWILEQHIQRDPDISRLWHANLVAAMRAEGVGYTMAVRGAARFMKDFFHINLPELGRVNTS